jgi:hypothetical protein
MAHKLIDDVMKRAVESKSESDFTYLFSLLLAAEALVKTTTLGLLAAVEDNRDHSRYRLEQTLVKSDGIGAWGQVLDEILASKEPTRLIQSARPIQAEFTKLTKPGEWQHDSVAELKKCLDTSVLNPARSQ